MITKILRGKIMHWKSNGKSEEKIDTSETHVRHFENETP